MPNFVDRSDFADGLLNASRTKTSMSAGRPMNFWASTGLSTTKVRTPAMYAWSMSATFLIGLVWIQRSNGRPSALNEIDFGPRRDVEAAPLAATARSTAGWGGVFTA